MANAHKRTPICFRPAETDDEWLRQLAEDAGESVNAILRRLVANARAASELPQEISR